MKGFKNKKDEFIPTEPPTKFGSNQINSSTDIDLNDTGFMQRASGKHLVDSSREIPSDSMKICSRCEEHFNIDASKNGRTLSHLPLCNKCDAKGLKPLGFPAHWVWNKMSINEKKETLSDVGIPVTNDKEYLHLDDFDDLPKELQDILKTKWGIEV